MGYQPGSAHSDANSFINDLRGKRVIITTVAVEGMRGMAYIGRLDSNQPDSLIVATDSGRRILLHKHAIVSIEAASDEVLSA